MDDFICVDIKEPENVVVDVKENKKNSKLWDIRKDGKRLWLKCENLVVDNGFQINTFKPDSDEGYLKFIPNDFLEQVVESIDETVISEFIGKVADNMKMTEKSVRRMFKPSINYGTLKVTASCRNCGFIDKDKQEIITSLKELPRLIQSETLTNAVLEPAFVWCMNKQIGIHWDVRQLQILGKSAFEDFEEKINDENELVEKTWKMSLNDDLSSEDEVDKKKKPSTSSSSRIKRKLENSSDKNTKKKAWSILDGSNSSASSSDDEVMLKTKKDPITKKITKSKPVIRQDKEKLKTDSSKAKWSILHDSPSTSDDD